MVLAEREDYGDARFVGLELSRSLHHARRRDNGSKSDKIITHESHLSNSVEDDTVQSLLTSASRIGFDFILAQVAPPSEPTQHNTDLALPTSRVRSLFSAQTKHKKGKSPAHLTDSDKIGPSHSDNLPPLAVEQPNCHYRPYPG
jgi:hypothetical protein